VNICVFICRYNLDFKEIERNFSYFNQELSYVIYDNSDNGTEALKDISVYNNVHYISESQNLGLAYALNQMIEYGLKNDFTHAIYFDQDSIIDKDMIDKLSHSFKDTRDVFCIGPMPVDYEGNDYSVRFNHNKEPLEKHLLEAKEVITSGMCFSLSKAVELNGFDERLFLDMIDFDISWRARNNGFKVLINKQVKMRHKVGESDIIVFGRRLPLSSPIRNYYQTRNNLYLLINGTSPLYYRYYMFFRRLVNISANLCFADKRFSRARYNFKGVIDAIFNKMGKISS
jgi:rhamnosyltransferase